MTDPTPSLPRIPRMCAATGCTRPSNGTRGGRCDQHTHTEAKRHNEATSYYRSREWVALRTACIDESFGQCCVCAGTHRLAAHHLVARKAGGKDVLSNLACLCQQCHSRIEKGDKETMDGLQEFIDIRNTL